MRLNIRILLAQSGTGDFFDITDVVESFTLSSCIGNQPSKLDLEIIGDGAEFELGSRIQIWEGENGVFEGWLFSISMSNDLRFSAIFYDQTRYLRNEDTLVFKKNTLSEVFKAICDAHHLNTGTIEESNYKVASEVYEQRALWDILQEYIDHTLAYEKRLFVIYDNFGKLELRDIVSLRSDFVIDDENVALGYDYNIGIDKSTYNQVKLGFENQSAGARQWGIVQNSDYIKKWGLLQKIDLLPNRISKDELDKKAEQLLLYYCMPTREVTLECFGDFKIRAGVGVQLDLQRIAAFNDMHNFYVLQCEHHVSCDKHTMSLVLAVDGFSG